MANLEFNFDNFFSVFNLLCEYMEVGITLVFSEIKLFIDPS